MGWFDEQINERRKADDEVFEESFLNMAGAVMGRRISDALNDDRQIAADAISEILKYLRVKAQEIPDTVTDMNEVLEYLLRPSGIMRRRVELEKGWYRDASGPMLGTRTDDGSLVALIPAGMNGYCFYDRTTGKRVRLSKRTEKLIEGEAIAFYKPFPLKSMDMWSLLKYILEQISPSDAALIALSMLAVTLVGMITPKLNEMLFSDVLASGSIPVLAGMGVFMACTGISLVLFTTVKSLITARVGTKLDLCVEAATMMRLLALPADFFKDYSSGELSNRAGYLNELSNQLVNVAMSAGLTSIFSLLYITQIFAFAPKLVAPALLVTLLTLVVTVVQVFIQMGISRQQMDLTGKEKGMSYQLISGIQKIRLAGAEKRAFARWAQLYSRSARLSYDPPMFLKTASVITLAISLIGTMVMYAGAIKSGVSVAEYYAFNTAYGMVNGAFMSLAGIAATIAAIRPTLEMAKPVMETVPEISEDKQVIEKLTGAIELNNVTFRYNEDMPNVLDNITLKIRPGQYVAIVGRTGCGKSTLMRILLGFETPQKGAVYYDGRDLKKIDLKSLRRRIGAVMQDGKMFTGDIFSNITISAPWLTLDDAWEAAKLAGIADDILDMPMGMNTLISEGQGGISGGQRQRLLIARAIAPKPKILMFDEATSALDNLTQKQVSDALDRMKCTRIVIAHRLSTIRQCDRIIVLDQGRIIEDGSYDELLAKNGYFADLVARQRLEEK
ncbi:MAG: NHLP bacteriocin export ABC transporter permease/ATPase subunit [Lachnospiraceae bacterium]|nr:NHLP bacteriocin export ABC transporter permease/ATPase subunit [Lachnospiraceae bacterium]